jgi:thiol-disulfide isomerase/thioredoxin
MSDQKTSMTKPLVLVPVVIVLALVGLGIYGLSPQHGKEQSPIATTTTTGLKTHAKGPLAALLVSQPAKEIAAFTFKDGSDKETTLASFKGKVVLLNLWATWCAPCRKEMPDLSNLQKQLGGADFEVVALSVDRKGKEASAAFLKEVAAENLALYIDAENKSLPALQALGLPATFVINREGKEVARLLGAADWDSPEVIALIKDVISAK